MTIRADIELPVARPAEAVWAELAAIERFPEWLTASGVTRVEREPGPIRTGTRLLIEQRVGGRPSVLEGVVTRWDPPSSLAFKATHPDGITVEADASVVPDGATSLLRWSLRVGLPLRLRLFESMATPEVRRAAATDVMGLKRRLEAVAG